MCSVHGPKKAEELRFNTALYSLAEAARLSRVPRGSLRNWVVGYAYPVRGKMVRAKPVIKTPKMREPTFSFINLIEVLSLAGFREAGVSMQRVRKALDYAAKHMRVDHLLASERVLTDGVDLFWEYQERVRDGVDLVNISLAGQKTFPETVMRYLREVEWGHDLFAIRWWPGSETPKSGAVVVDPKRAFGAPVLAGTGIRTEDVFHRFFAGERIGDLAEDYGLKVEQIEAAIRLEARLLEPIAA